MPTEEALRAAPAEARDAFARTLNLMHDHPDERGRIYAEVREWYRLFSAISGVDAYDFNGSPNIVLPSGKAISAAGAAQSLLEAQRTAVFLRGIERALRDLQRRFPGERLRVLYAGCGPFASLLTPLTARFSAAEVGWHLLDINPHAIEAVRRVYAALELEPYLLGVDLADASEFVLPAGEPYHLVVSETMQRALQNETQLAVMLNLLPQMQADALFVPQRITVSAQVVFPRSSPEQPAPTLRFAEPVYEIGQTHAAPPEDFRLTVPALDAPGHLELTTEVQVYGEERLSGHDSSITLAKDMRLCVRGGESLLLRYQWHPRPGFVCDRA